MNTLQSIRIYTIVYLESDFTYSNPCVKLSDIYDDDYKEGKDFEWKYAIQDNIDKVLDLREGERLQMNFNRDNKDSAGFIKRIK
jgi:hypothetical protein